MASTDLVTAARRDIFVGDIEENRPNSENVNRKVTGNINFILERMVIQEKFVFNGFFNAETAYDAGVGGITRIENDAKISHYMMSIMSAGSGGTNHMNVAIYDGAGASVGNLFSTAPAISGSNGFRTVVGKEGVDTLTPTNFQVNTAGHSINHGVLSFTTLLSGWILVPYIIGAATVNAYNLAFSMKLKEI